jgi:predicted acyltransferase (DUF342 family)
MNKILVFIIAMSFSLTACGGFLGSKSIADNTESPNKDFDTVNGSIKVGHHANVGDLSTVNGSVKVASNSKVGEASTVNGSVVFATDVTADSAETVNGSIKLGENCNIENKVETVNGSVTAESGCNIGGDFETVNGKLKATNTEIHGNVQTVNGSIILLQGTVVFDDIIVRKNKSFFGNSNKKKPKIVLGKSVEVKGDLEFGRPVILFIHDSVDMDDDIDNAEVHRYSGDDLPF